MGVPEEKSQFTEEQLEFIDYLATPVDLRGTQKDFAKKIGVSEKTISQWKKKPEIIEAAYERKVQLVKANDTPEIIDALVREAKKGSYNHIKLYKEWFHDSTPRNRHLQQINITFPDALKKEENPIDIAWEENES